MANRLARETSPYRWGVVALVRRGSSTSEMPPKRDPLDIARERYAKGEITKDEFEEIKKNLSSRNENRK